MTRIGKSKATQDEPVQEINGYLAQLELNLKRDYSPDQRAVFVAALAERRLAKYEASSQAVPGQVTALRAALQAVWNYVQGDRVNVSELERLRDLISAGEATGSSPQRFVKLALESCATQDNLLPAKKAALADYEAVLKPPPGYPEDLSARKKAWRQPEVISAIDHQQTLLMHARLPSINAYMVDFLQRDARAEVPFRLETSTFVLPTGPGEPAEPESELPILDLQVLAGSAPQGSILQNLASMIGKLQQGIFPEELLKRAAEAGADGSRFAPSVAEKEHAERLEAAMAAWNNEQRIAFCAALAEQWLPVYQSFASEEGWGDPDVLRRSLDSVWDHLGGSRLSRPQGKRYSRQIIENTPDTEEFDAPLAMAACEILDHTLSACLEAGNLGAAVSAGMAGCSYLAMLGQGLDYRGDDPTEEERLWQQPAVRQEMARQSALLSRIASFASLDKAAIQALRQNP